MNGKPLYTHTQKGICLAERPARGMIVVVVVVVEYHKAQGNAALYISGVHRAVGPALWRWGVFPHVGGGVRLDPWGGFSATHIRSAWTIGKDYQRGRLIWQPTVRKAAYIVLATKRIY